MAMSEHMGFRMEAWRHQEHHMPELQSLDAKRPKGHANELRTLRASEIISNHDELSGSKDNPHLYIHNLSKPPVGGMKGMVEINATQKKEMIGQPYKVKSKLPFYDSKGTF